MVSDKTMNIAVSPRKEELRPEGPVEGTVIKACENCEEEVYASPTTADFLERHPMTLLCFRCARIVAQLTGGAHANWAIGDGVPVADDKEAN